MLEVLTSRYYKIRTLLNPASSAVDGHCYVSAEYDHEGKRIHVFAAYAEYQRTNCGGEGDCFRESQRCRLITMSSSIFTCAPVGKLSAPDTTQLEVQVDVESGWISSFDPSHRGGSCRWSQGQRCEWPCSTLRIALD